MPYVAICPTSFPYFTFVLVSINSCMPPTFVCVCMCVRFWENHVFALPSTNTLSHVLKIPLNNK